LDITKLVVADMDKRFDSDQAKKDSNQVEATKAK